MHSSFPSFNVVMTSTSALFEPPVTHNHHHHHQTFTQDENQCAVKQNYDNLCNPVVLGHVVDEFSSMVMPGPQQQGYNFYNAGGSHYGTHQAQETSQRSDWFAHSSVSFNHLPASTLHQGFMPQPYMPPMGFSQHSSIADTSSSYNQSQWTDEEHNKFLVALEKFCPEACRAREKGKVFVGLGAGVAKKISQAVGTRSVLQVRSHAQKHFLRESKKVKAETP